MSASVSAIRVLPDYYVKARTYFKDAFQAMRELIDNIIAQKTWNKPASGRGERSGDRFCDPRLSLSLVIVVVSFSEKNYFVRRFRFQATSGSG